DRLAREIHAFVEALGDPHGVARAEAQLPRGLLLQRGGGERRERVASRLLALDRYDGEGIAGLEPRDRRPGGSLVGEVELVEPAPVEMGEAGGEAGSRGV